MTEIPARKETSIAEEMAFQLVQSAVSLDSARQERNFAPEALVEALNQNVETWVALRSIIKRSDCGLDGDVRENLDRLAQFVAERTFSSGKGGEAGLIEDGAIDSLININLQISEGLLEGERKKH